MKVIAHRGNDGIHHENSMEAILNSLSLPCVNGIEIDIRHTKDYDFVICHDAFYNGCYIKKTKLKNLMKKGLNSLEEVLEQIKTDKIIIIEIKEETSRYKLMLIKLHKLLKKYNLNYYICSFNYNLIKYFKKKHPEYNVGLIIGIKMNVDKINNNFDFNMINYRHAQKAPNKETFIWTIDNETTLKTVKKGQHIITNKVKEIYELINDEK